MDQLRIPAWYMRGGTSKGVFFLRDELPEPCQVPGPARDRLLLRVIGSPDPYGQHIDGMGGGSSSTSKCVILAPSRTPDHDVDYLFGQVAIDRPLIDWSGNCGNLSAAVGPCAIARGLVPRSRLPSDGEALIRIHQLNTGKTILAHVPMRDGEVVECGDFELDGVAFPAAEIRLEFLDPAEGEGALFPTGAVQESLPVPGLGEIAATLINAGIPTVFVRARDLGFSGLELQKDINTRPEALELLEAVRVAGALRMGLIARPEDAAERQHTPKIAFLAPPASYVAQSGRLVRAEEIDLNVRAVSMGKLHHAMMGTVAVAIAAAAAVPGTLLAEAMGGAKCELRFGHPSGSLRVGAEAERVGEGYRIRKVAMSRSARVLMEGFVRVPASVLAAATATP